MLLELLKIRRQAIKDIGRDAAEIGQKLGIEPSWIVYEKKHIIPRLDESDPTTKQQDVSSSL